MHTYFSVYHNKIIANTIYYDFFSMALSVHMRLSDFVLHLIMQALNFLYCCIVLILL